MKISEVRERIKGYTNEELTYLVAELYKAMPKAMREEKDVDDLVMDPHPKQKKKKEETIDEDALFYDVSLFLAHAYERNFIVPNRSIQKKNRSRWRFMVKDYMKKLSMISVNTPNGKKATDYIVQLYEMLTYACTVYLFNTEDPFRSIGITQPSMFRQVIARLLVPGSDEEMLKKAIDLTVKNEYSMDTMHYDIILSMVLNLKETPYVPIMEQMLLDRIAENEKQLQVKKKQETKVNLYVHNHLIYFLGALYIHTGKGDKGIRYMKKHLCNTESTNLYEILFILYLLDETELFEQLYAETERKHEITGTLKHAHERLIETGTWDEYEES